MRRATTAAICLLAAAFAGCTTSPTRYAVAMPDHDPKSNSPQCREMRAAAATYDARERPVYMSAGLLLGPYGLAIAASAKQHQARQRKIFARDMFLACSSQPVPKELEVGEITPRGISSK